MAEYVEVVIHGPQVNVLPSLCNRAIEGHSYKLHELGNGALNFAGEINFRSEQILNRMCV